MPRLFVALEIPDNVRSEIARLCRGLPDVRWTDPDDFHLTLRFVGEVDHNTFCDLGEALASICQNPFELTLQGIGQFPSRGPLRHLWVGAEASDDLLRLKRKVERQVVDCGIEPDRRKFTPHVTIARLRSPPPESRLASWLVGRSLFRTSSFPVSRFTLFSSHLRPEGAEHITEAEYDFVTGVMERA